MLDSVETALLKNLREVGSLLEGQLRIAKDFNARRQLLSAQSAAAIEHLAKAQVALALAEKQLRITS